MNTPKTKTLTQWRVTAKGVGPYVVETEAQAAAFLAACPTGSNPLVERQQITVSESGWQVVTLGNT
ncbi:hypothetical protein BH790_gp50 [Gordonia phage Gsput1]|uniref:Uncharacterized protein n=1 Tax=Gordonia phage Gsput1 TaxID=1622193 RepID=A0A0E3T8B4_9CAUD|nr:hypothetical protein BH790_gp50 [Gordonia phage Gsput1]AKC03075.1 hypothetical protein Gsput1_50 [Gordonia phage Gsput1]